MEKNQDIGIEREEKMRIHYSRSSSTFATALAREALSV